MVWLVRTIKKDVENKQLMGMAGRGSGCVSGYGMLRLVLDLGEFSKLQEITNHRG